MSVLAYPPVNDDEIFRICTKECGVITATEDQQFFALSCLFCAEKFLYFDAFIGHMQTMHIGFGQKGYFEDNYNEQYHGGEQQQLHDGADGSPCGGAGPMGRRNDSEGCVGIKTEEEDITDTSLLEPQMVMIKEELEDEEESFMPGFPPATDLIEDDEELINPLFVKQEHCGTAEMPMDTNPYAEDSYNNYDDYSRDGTYEPGEDDEPSSDDGENYDDLVEESLLGGPGLAMHIKDRKMIQFLIDSYRCNPFLWDHSHLQFRDRIKRQQFLDWIINEFKRRFNLSLAKDAVTRKWDNLRTVYKRECNRMALENSNVSTLWYFKELHFLHRLYGGSHHKQMAEAVIKEPAPRRRYSALWNDVSTLQLLAMIEQYPCFYDKYNVDYRSKEKRGEALQAMAAELQKMIDVTTIQISKRISQLRFDYSKQKQERLHCETNNLAFVPSYSYYDQMQFMDTDVAPFKCDYCPLVVHTPRELDVHQLTHQTNGRVYCLLCHAGFADNEELARHKHQHHPTATKDGKRYSCDLCTASFREKSNYNEHMRRHNDELLLPGLTKGGGAGSGGGVKKEKSGNVTSPALAAAALAAADGGIGSLATGSTIKTEKPYTCDVCGKTFAHTSHLNSHRVVHSTDRCFRCDYPHCGRTFTARHSLNDHMKLHFSDEVFKCDVCGKCFRSTKNLQNHKQIHDAIKKYVCKICGSAFAQAAGLYLHKRRHNKQTDRSRNTL